MCCNVAKKATSQLYTTATGYTIHTISTLYTLLEIYASQKFTLYMYVWSMVGFSVIEILSIHVVHGWHAFSAYAGTRTCMYM